MRYGSVCSGIEAASVAWESLNWEAAWFSEIEKFPSAVLAQRWPAVKNLGDMTKIAAAVASGEVETPDVLVGGTPCQAFSIAGLRNGLSDTRGQLTLSYVELANAIDKKRTEAGKAEAIIVWENVPGVLSSKDNAFGCFLAGIAGESSELQPPGGKWTNAGCVSGPQRVIAWRTLDAQFFGVAQRRRRVFVVASARNDIDPAKILFELDSMRRDTPPSRSAGTVVASLTANGVGTCGADDNQGQAGHLIATGLSGDIAHTLKARGFDGSEDGTGRGTPIIAFGGGNRSGDIDVAACLTAKGQRNDFEVETFAVHGTQDPDTCHNLAHTIGRNQGQENAVISFSYKDHGADCGIEIAPTIRAGNSNQSHANSGQPPAICIQHAIVGRADKNGPQGKGFQEDIAFTQDANPCSDIIQNGLDVRRLTPIECERLQGFPDNHTLIAWRGSEPGNCPDGPRYKAIGNSMAVPVMRWIGERIAAAVSEEINHIGETNEKAATDKATYRRPFLKWAGGKYSQLADLQQYIPAGKRLIEPFVGGGSVFMNSSKHADFLLADVNADLINLYQMLAVVPETVVSTAQGLFDRLNTADGYKFIRGEFNAQSMSAPDRAAAFLYINRHCFNGLIRYNQSGDFNVGFGKYRAPYFPEAEIAAFTDMAHKCVFMHAGFEHTLSLAGTGDVVYCDPPYEPLPGTAGFTSYAAGGFNWADQVRLAESCVAAHQRGARIVISNSAALRVINLYQQHGYSIKRVKARRSISSKGITREIVTDILAIL